MDLDCAVMESAISAIRALNCIFGPAEITEPANATVQAR